VEIKIIEVNEEPDLSQYISLMLEEFLKQAKESAADEICSG